MPSRRLPEPGHSLSWRALVLVLVLAFPAPALAKPTGEDPAAPQDILVHDPLEAWFLGDPASELRLPTDLDSLLSSLRPRGPRASADSAWDAYFAAMGLSPTADERARLEEVLLAHPALLATLDPVVRDLAHAQATRDAVFARFTPEERAQLVHATALLASGDAAVMTAADWALLARVDVPRLASAAAQLARAARAMDDALPAALAADARVADALPPGLAEALASRDAFAVLAALAQAEPAPASVSWRDALQAASPDALSPQALHVPPDLAAPLAAVVSAVLGARATPEPEDDRAALAAVAAAVPALVRASHNLSLRAPGDLDGLAGGPRPVETMRRSGDAHAALVLADLLGPAAGPEPATLVTGHARLREALGLPPDAALSARVRDLETRLGPELSLALGTLLAAQARYQADLAPEAPVVVRARERAAAAAPVLDSNAPLSSADLATLAASAQAQADLRALTGARVGDVLHAVAAMESLATTSPVALTGVVFRDEAIMIYGVDDNEITPNVVPAPPVLLLDLGGDDVYTAPVAGVDLLSATVGVPVEADVARTSIVVDLGGNDRYVAPRPFTLGAARGLPFAPALGMLVDADGNDAYVGANSTLGIGVDGFGILVDRRGDDAYETLAGLGLAEATTAGSMAAGVLVDAMGADDYWTRQGFAHIRNTTLSPLAAAVFLDVAGPDDYRGECPRDMPCFGTPRHEEPVGTPGVIVFVDGGGENRWPRGAAPSNVTGVPSVVDHESPFNGARVVFVSNGLPVPADSDGDLIFDAVEASDAGRRLGLDERNATLADPELGDSDRDGWPDYVETILRTRPDDAQDAPVGLPRPPSPAPNPHDALPGGGAGYPGRPSSSNFLVNLPGVLAIGLPGTTTYRESYNLTIDLGIADVATASPNDRYFGATAADSVAIDLGGNDLYAPVPFENGAPRRLAWSTGVPALLLDLAGNDAYTVERDGQARAGSDRTMLTSLRPPGRHALAILLDAGGNDRYYAPRGGAHAYATSDGSAYLLDLDGDDHYTGVSQGVAQGNASLALFVDLGGEDTYDRTTGLEDTSAWGDHQGVVVEGTRIGANALAGFVDLSGRDRHRVADGATFADAPDRNNRLRVRPLDDPRAGGVAIYLDTSVAGGGTGVDDSDSDGAGDAAETAAGTDADNATRRPTGPAYFLDLPRLGVAIATSVVNHHESDYALLVDLGGSDTYANRAGASTPLFPTALLVDHGPDHDAYLPAPAVNLSAYLFPKTNGDGSALGLAPVGGVRPQVGDATDATLAAAQGAGIFGVGVLIDGGGQNWFTAAAETRQCATCEERAIGLGVAQGAGVVGVGILDVRTEAAVASRFLVDVVAGANSSSARPPAAIARGVAQGAGVFGVGVLSVQAPASRDEYEVRVRAEAKNGSSASAGQGYALRGIGVLLDHGGSNTFTAAGLAQAAADDDNLTTPLPRSLTAAAAWPSDHFMNRARGAFAALLLPGVGSDVLSSTSRSQAYAGAGGVAVLFDAEGHDVRTLSDAGTSSGQAAAMPGGAAYLIDNRGDDRNVAAGQQAQAFAHDGLAVLVDVSGSDVYEARGRAQATVLVSDIEAARVGSFGAAPPPAVALFIDRMGADRYGIPNGVAAQGTTLKENRVVLPTATVGVAAFVDGGGFDDYQGRAADQATKRTPTGNGGTPWSTSAAPFLAVGVDDNTIGNAFATLAGQLSTLGTGATLTSHEPTDASLAWDGNGTARLRAVVKVHGASSTLVVGSFDRAEFQYEGLWLGRGEWTGASFDYLWNTMERDGHRPRFPDGERTLQVLMYPRAGTPVAADSTGRRAAVDVEPLPARHVVRIDNPPLAQPPVVPTKLSVAWSPVTLPLWIDRDLERGECPLCGPSPHLAPGVDEWDLPRQDPPGVAYAAHGCLDDGCVAKPIVKSGDGAAYVTWAPPATGASEVTGYLLVRAAGGANTTLSLVDARAPLRFRDASPPEGAAYRIGTIRLTPAGETIAWSTDEAHEPRDTPGPALGVRAAGAENALRVVWRSVESAILYRVERSQDGVFFNELATVPDTTFLDEVGVGALHDVTYHYRVVPLAPDGDPSEVPATVVTARAAPGALASVWLDGETNVSILDRVPLGGGQFHALPWDATAAPEGPYTLHIVLEDGGEAATRAEMPVVLDRHPPEAQILVPPVAGADYIGAGGVRIPVAVRDAASGAEDVAAAARIEGGPWLSLGRTLLSNLTLQEDGSHLVNFILPGVADGQEAEVVAVAVDHAGNVGGLAPRPWPVTLALGLQEAQARGGTVLRFDFVPPIVRATPLESWVQPNATVRLEAKAADTGTGIREVRARVGSTVVPLRDMGSFVYAAEHVVRDVGQHQVVYEAVDNAGNLARDAAGILVVDDAPPLVEEARVTFSGGRSVGTPGETARILVRATDAATPSESLNVTLDASNVSSRGAARLSWSRLEQIHAAEIVVDRVAPVSESNVTLRVADRAGNFVNVTLAVPIDAVPAGFASPVSVEARADRAWLNWTSREPVRGRVDYGLGPQLGSESSLGPVERNHSLLVTGLTPASRYFAKAVLVTDAGIETMSPLVEFATSPGLVVSLSPVQSFPYARDGGRLSLDVWTHDGKPASAAAEVFLIPPRGSPALVADAPRPGAFDVDLRGFRDGTYAVVARAKADGLTGQSAPLQVVLDRAPPIVDLATEAVIVPGEELVLTAMERGSGIDVSKVVILVDGKPCVASLAGDELKCVAPDVKNATVNLSVSVADRAGNAGSFHTRLPAAARDGALLRLATLLGETGTEFIKPGRTATLLVEADAVGIERVVADLRVLGGAAEQEIPYAGQGRYQHSFNVPRSLAVGPVVVPIAAYDRAERARHLVAAGFIDDAPARAETLEVLAGASPGSVAVRVIANEPVRLRVEAPGAHAQRDEYRAETQVVLSGLRPGRAFQALVTLTDRAGNVATLTADGASPPDTQRPELVTDLRAVDLGDGRVVLLWSPAPDNVGIDAYRVYQQDGASRTLVGEATGTRFEADAPPGVKVSFVVTAVDVGGNEGEGVAVEARSIAVPRLSDGRVDPPLGGPGLYEFRINVTQSAGGAPAVDVIVDGRPVRMTADAADCRDGCVYRAVVSLGPQSLEGGGHRFSFVAHHEGLSVRLPEGGQTIQGPVVVGSIASSVLQGASRVPLTPMVGLAGVVVAAAAIVAWRMLRRKS